MMDKTAVLAWIRRLAKEQDTPEALARGLAVGFFFGVSFFWGLQVVLAIVVSHWVRGNKVVAAAVTLISNPLTSLPLYTFCYFIGHLVMGSRGRFPDLASVHSTQALLDLGPRFLLTMVVGTTLVGVVGAVPLYFLSEEVLETLRRWHDRR
jgi:uncharacterized protein (DUF2062 family)